MIILNHDQLILKGQTVIDVATYDNGTAFSGKKNGPRMIWSN